MKILFITDLYPVSQDEKTTPKTLFDFVNEWRNLGYEIDVIKPNFILNSFLRRKPFYKTGQYGNVLNLNFFTPFWGKIKLPEKKYDIAIAHMPSGILYADRLGLPFVAGFHNSDLEILTNPLYKFHFKKRLLKALNNAKAIACRSIVLKNKLLTLYPQFENKTFTAFSGVDVSPCEKEINLNELRVLTCANYKKSKNIEKVLEAVNGLDCFKLTVIGAGTDTQKLHKLNSNVSFKGFLPHEKVLENMKNSDIFILPSTGETFGMVYLEAMACGCITICSKNDGIEGIIKNKINGFTVTPSSNDIRDLLLSIKSMDCNSLKVLQHNSIETVKELTKQKCSENYLQQILRFCKDLT